MAYRNTVLPTLAEVQEARRANDHARVVDLAKRLIGTPEQSDRLSMWAGEAAQRLGRFDEAVDFYQRVSDSQPETASLAQWAMAEIRYQEGKMSECLKLLERSLELDANNDRARDRLVTVLHLAGRRWEAFPHLFQLARKDNWDFDRMRLIGNPVKPVENEAELKRFQDAQPEDPLPKLGLAKMQVRLGKNQEALPLLEEVLRKAPELVEAHVQLGKILLATDATRLPDWQSKLPDAANQHPEIWWIRGEWSRMAGQDSAAARCYSEAMRLDPDHAASAYAMAQALTRLGRPEEAVPFAKRVETIEALTVAIDQVNPATGYFPPIQEAAFKTFELGRVCESWAWTRLGVSRNRSAKELRAHYDRLQPIVRMNMPLRDPATVILQGDEYRDLALPDWNTRTLKSDVPNETNPAGPAKSMANQEVPLVESQMDLGFTYFASRPPPIQGRRMFESTGGGIGVLDYDHDGWPDLFFAQGTRWPVDGKDAEHRDLLLRNSQGVQAEKGSNGPRRFHNVTGSAGISEAAFGQGVTVGDLNSDGFDDLYVNNVGVNQWWINQGDGTFRSGNGWLDDPKPAWTVSSFMADLNLDGNPEVYDARYVEGVDVYERLCNVEGLPRTCPPLVFKPSPGRLLTTGDDGNLIDISAGTIAGSVQEGNALGVVVFRTAGQRMPSMFVGNDQVANLFLVAKPKSDAPLGWIYEDEALSRGLAFDASGKAQACMGIASGDADGDGRTDLLVTNFLGEYNTLYLQRDSAFFEDASAAAGLVGPSLDMLGFGCQFADVNLDGHLDLLVLNGHIDDLAHAGRPYRMRPQFFWGLGQGGFREANFSQPHSFFSLGALGRALALLDFNRDGKLDFVTTDLEQPSKVLENRGTGNWLIFRLVGTRTHRDATGTIVTVRVTADWQRSEQLVAGFGYMVSNEKLLHFGLGNHLWVEKIQVDWPSGTTETFGPLPANSQWLLVEGQGIQALNLDEK